MRSELLLAQGDLFHELHARTGLMSEQEVVNTVALPLLRALVHMHDQVWPAS